jgi:uncharacterized protein
LAYVAICVAAGIFVAEAALHPTRRRLGAHEEETSRRLSVNLGTSLENVEIVAEDGATLRAWSLLPSRGNGNSVILLHGLGDNRMGMIGYAELLLGHGYGILMPDSRAHGQSGGALATYGLIEKDDIHRWMEWISTQQHPGCIYGFGESMGAAQLLQALAPKPTFCAVAAESPFSSFREIAYDRVGQFFHTGPWAGRIPLRPTVEIALAYINWKYGFAFQDISPEDSVAGSHLSVFLIHGKIDRNIPLRHSKRIQAHNPQVVLWEVANADHCGAINADPGQFAARLLAWFRPPVSVTQLFAVPRDRIVPLFGNRRLKPASW